MRFSLIVEVMLVAGLAWILPAPPSQAAGDGEYQFGNVLYHLPAGWRKGGTKERCVTLYTDLRAKGVFATMRIYASLPGEDVDKAMKRHMAAELKADDAKLEKALEAKSAKVGNAEVRFYARVVRGGSRRMQMYFARRLPDRIELVRFEGPARDPKDTRASGDLINRDVLPMMVNLRFVSEGGRSVLGGPTPGDLEGVWWGGGLQLRPDPNGLMSDFVTRTLTFYKNGRCFDGIPPDGVGAFDYDALAATRTNDVGNYARRGDKLILSFADGDVETLDISDTNVITDGVKRLTRARVPEDGYRFEGTRQSLYVAGIHTGVGSTGTVSSSSTQVFKKDGTFTDGRFGGAFGNFDHGGGFAVGNRGDGGGTYEVKGGQLLLADRSGKTRVWEILVLPAGGAGDRASIIVQGNFLK